LGLVHLEQYTMVNGGELMLLSNVLRKAVSPGDRLNKRNLLAFHHSLFIELLYEHGKIS
jgi:hypothetical protein